MTEEIPEKVKVVSTLYDIESGMISWTVKLKGGRQADLLWTKQEFGPTFGINADIPDSLIKEFCENMKGKNVKLVISGEK